MTRASSEVTSSRSSWERWAHREGSKPLPETLSHPVTHACDQPRQGGHARQEDLPLNEACGGQVKKHTRGLCAEPGSGIEPAKQTEIFPTLVKAAIPIGSLNLPCMLPRSWIAPAVEQQARGVGDAELCRNTQNNGGWDRRRIRQKASQVADRAKLQPKTQPIVRTAPVADKREVEVIQIEAAR